MTANNLSAGSEPAEFVLYQTEDGQTRLEVRLQEDTVWLTQKRMAELFQKNVRTLTNISKTTLMRVSWHQNQLSGNSG